MLGNISHSSILRTYCLPCGRNLIAVVPLSWNNYVIAPQISTVKLGVLKFTKELIFVHNLSHFSSLI